METYDRPFACLLGSILFLVMAYLLEYIFSITNNIHCHYGVVFFFGGGFLFLIGCGGGVILTFYVNKKERGKRYAMQKT